MGLNSFVSQFRGALSTRQTLELANFHLEYARKTKDPKLALVMCDDAESALSYVKRNAKWAPKYADDQVLRDEIATAYFELGKLQDFLSQHNKAKASYSTAEKWGYDEPLVLIGPTHYSIRWFGAFYCEEIDRDLTSRPNKASSFCISSFTSSAKSASEPIVDTLPDDQTIAPETQPGQHSGIPTIPTHIFAQNVHLPTIEFKLPETDERLQNTPQLAWCLGLLQSSHSNDEALEPATRDWIRTVEKDTDEQERLKTMAKEVLRAFKRDEFKDARAVTEVVYLAPILDKDSFRYLLKEFYSGIDRSGLLDVHQLEGLAQLIQGADPSYLDGDDLVKILGLLSRRLMETHQQSRDHMHQLTLAVSHVLDAMADAKVHGLDREKLHEPLSSYLEGLKKSSDPFLVYQAAYAYQALLCVPDNDTLWQAAMRHTGRVIRGVSGLVSAVKGLDLVKFIEGLENIREGLEGASRAATNVAETLKDMVTLSESGQNFLSCLRDTLSLEHKSVWYSALRGADILIQTGELAKFRQLVCAVPCRRDPIFQCGVCQRLGEIAASPKWNTGTRRMAVEFLGEIYQDDANWSRQVAVKQWILNILTHLASSSRSGSQFAGALLQDLEASTNTRNQAIYQECRERGPSPHPLRVPLPDLASPSLLDRVQNRPDVEGNIRLLRKQRLKEHGNAVYIPPQAKANLQAPDNARFPLMEKVEEFFNSEQKVFLILGDSGAGKSTFSMELERVLWQKYKNKVGRIPLRINLPAIEKPEHDMISKQLRRVGFTEPQIRELKLYRKFILICDGYDESQQTHNLYRSNRLNQPGEWDTQMVISCRSEYIGNDYRDRFQPGDRNKKSDSTLFQEAVITPFSINQGQSYIKQYVSIHQPLWRVKDYRQALDLIPSLKDLVKNPFLMTLSLEVLPRMVDPGEQLRSARVTRVALYDQFVEQWLERGKQRLEEKDLTPQARTIFESLSDEGFTQNGIDFIKKLAVAIYKKQGGQPVVEYSRFKDEGSWKDEFFSRKDKQLLREACPLTRNGNQYRFIHRSLLEYGLALAIFDPQDAKKSAALDLTSSRRGSVNSALSFEILNTEEEIVTTVEQEPDANSPLVWRSFVNDHSLLQFLEERVQQEPVFKKQLLAYIEHSKSDKKWRAAAANAITILVRAGVQFIGADLRGIRVPGADLSYGVFDSALLQGADLRKVNLRGVWLRLTDLSKSEMTGVQFGEFPFLKVAALVQSCAYSPDGKLFAIGLENGDIHVHSTSNWERVQTWQGHDESVRSVVFSPRGGQVASASEDRTVRLWNVESDNSQHVLIDHSEGVNGVVYSPHGDQVASASSTTVKVWDTPTGSRLSTLSGHTDLVLSVVYSPDGKQIASASMDFTVRLWNVAAGICSHILTGHGDNVWSAVFSPLGNQIASASDDNTLRLWDSASGACLHILVGHISDVFTVAYSPKGDQVASGSQDGTVRLWDVESGSCRQTLVGHSGSVTSVVFSPRGDQVASGCWDETVRFWDVSARASRYVSNGHSVGVMSVKCSPRGGQIASCSYDSTIRLWDMETGACRRVLNGHHLPVCCVAYSSQGDQIASASNDYMVLLWDVETGVRRNVLTDHTDDVNGVAFSPRGDLVVSCSSDKTVRLWDTATGECCSTFSGHESEVLGVAYSPKGNQVASCGGDHIVRLWDTTTGICSHTLVGHSDQVNCVTYSPRGDQVASSGDDKTVRLWDAESGACSLIFTGHSGEVLCVAFSPQGELLASGSTDRAVRFWDVATGQCRGVVRNFQSDIYSIAWSTTSLTFVTGCGDGSVLMWDVVGEGDLLDARLCWSSTNGVLTVTGASIQDVQGLSQLNAQLLKQREAVGEPVHILREAGKKLIGMAAVISKLKQSSVQPMEDPTSAIVFPDQ